MGFKSIFYISFFATSSLSLLNLSHLFHKLVLQGLKAVETDGGHVPVLHRDRSLCGLVLPQEGEVLKMGEHATGELDSGEKDLILALVSQKSGTTPKMSSFF